MTRGFSLLGDQPNSVGRDALGFHEVAERLAQLMLSSRSSSPFTVGIDGGWGAGKSSLMMRLKQELDAKDDVVTIWFNAWTAEGKDVLESLIKSVLNRIDSNILRRALRRKRLISVARIVISGLADLLRLRTVADEVWRQMQLSVETRNEIQSLMRTAMSDWTSKSSGPGKRSLCVFIDDLDRCSPSNVLQVFEAMKLYLDVPGFIFIVGYDKQIISEVILRQLGYGEDVKSLEYLEKIVQFVYSITPPTDSSARNLIADYLGQAQIESLVGESERNFLIDRSGRNPRRIKRFINNFVLAYQLDSEWHDIGAQNLVMALILQMYYPEVVASIWQRRGSDFFQECIDFAEARRLLRNTSVDESDWPRIEHVFQVYNLDTSDLRKSDTAETLRISQEEVPPITLKSANDPEFIKFAQSIGTGDNRIQLLQKLELRWQPPISLEDQGRSGSTTTDYSASTKNVPAIYISYRRQETAYVASRVSEQLAARFGREDIFIDVDAIQPGEDFQAARLRGIGKATIVLVLIGPQWLTVTDDAGRRRIHDPDDFVRGELEFALTGGQAGRPSSR